MMSLQRIGRGHGLRGAKPTRFRVREELVVATVQCLPGHLIVVQTGSELVSVRSLQNE